MSNITLPGPLARRARLPRWTADLAVGAAHWLIFLLLLEPGNLISAHDAGRGMDAGREVLRIGGAVLLGVAATPPLLWLVRSRPVRGPNAWRHAVLHATGATVIAAAMIAVSCPLAAWLIGGPAALGDAIRAELTQNWALVLYGVVAFLASAHALQFPGEATPASGPAEPGYLTRVKATAGRRTVVLDLAQVDWIESQGNYLALRAGGATHLVRDTLSNLERRLDPARFARIHRRRIVALDRVVQIRSLDSGDAQLQLRDGSLLRLSRSYRRAVRARL